MTDDAINFEVKNDHDLLVLTASAVNAVHRRLDGLDEKLNIAVAVRSELNSMKATCNERHGVNHKPWGTLAGTVTGLSALGWLVIDKVW